MVRRFALVAGLLVVGSTLGGCFSITDFEGDVRQINHYGKEIHKMRVMTNKYFMDYDVESPFED